MNTQDTDIIETIDFYQPKLKRRVNLVTGIIALLVTMVFSTILEFNGFTSLFVLIVLGLLIPETAVHESLHYLFYWRFSNKKPHIGFKFPFPHCALSPTSSVTRNQAVLAALAPAFIITPILAIPALFATFLPRILLLAWASLALASCYGDFYITYRLFKSPSDARLKNINLANVIYRPKSH